MAPVALGLGLFNGELAELVDEFAEPAGVVEPGLVALVLFGAQRPGDGLAVDLAGPGRIGAVQVRR